jgi:hypothetical protein
VQVICLRLVGVHSDTCTDKLSSSSCSKLTSTLKLRPQRLTE